MTPRFVSFTDLEDGHAKLVQAKHIRIVEDTELGVAVTLVDGSVFAAQGKAADILAQLETP